MPVMDNAGGVRAAGPGGRQPPAGAVQGGALVTNPAESATAGSFILPPLPAPLNE